MNIYLFIYIILIIILIFFIINLFLNKVYKQKKNILFEKFEDMNDISIDQSVFDAANSNSFSDSEDPGQAISDLSIPNMERVFEETITNQYNGVGNIQRPPILLSLSSSTTQSSKKESSDKQLYPSEIIRQAIQNIDKSNLPQSILDNLVLPEENKFIIPRIIAEQEEECCKPPSPKLHDLVCGDHYDKCRVDQEGNDNCCDGYTCLRPNGNFGYKKCLNESDNGFKFKVPDVDTTGYYDLTVPKTDLSELRIPSIDINGIKDIKGFNIGSIFSKLNPLNSLCSTDKYNYNKWTGELTENSSKSISS